MSDQPTTNAERVIIDAIEDLYRVNGQVNHRSITEALHRYIDARDELLQAQSKLDFWGNTPDYDNELENEDG